MPDNIETTIYRLQVDGSAYIDGVDKVSASTDKLSAAQLKANQRLAELKSQLNSSKKSLEEINAVIQANEKEVIDLTKQLNALRDSGKGSTAEMLKLKAQLRDLSVNTKEFKVEATELRTKIAQTTTEIKSQSVQVKSLATAHDGFNLSMGKVHGGLSRIAQLIPGLGIGGLVALLAGPVINAFQGWIGAMDEASSKAKILSEAFSSADYQKAITDVNSLTLNIKLAKEGFLDKDVVLKQYNDTLGKSLGQVKSLDEAEQNLVSKGPAYIQMTLLKAAANLALDKAAKIAVDAAIDQQKSEENLVKVNRKGQTERDKAAGAAGLGEFLSRGLKNEAAAAKREADKGVNQLKTIAENFQRDAAVIAQQFNINFDPVAPPKIKTAVRTPPVREIENVYEQKLLELNARLASVTARVFQDEGLIRKEFETQLAKEFAQIEKLLKEKRLTGNQAIELKAILVNINDVQLTKELDEFAAKRKEVEERINTQIAGVRLEGATQRINNIRDDFEQERLTVDAAYDNTIATIKKKEKDLIDKIGEDVKKGLLSKADASTATNALKILFGDLLTEAGVARTNRQLDLAMKVFQNTIKESQEVLANQLLNLSEEATEQIQLLTEKYLEGKVNFEKYQKGITKILKDEAKERKRLQLEELKSELERIDQLLIKTTDADQQLQLSRQQRNVRSQISGLQRDIATDDGKTDTDGDKRIDEIVKYAQAIGTLTTTVIGFWEKMNEAELKSLDKSISLQEKRVDAARRIAERGNAQYLKLEEDRLTALNVKKENAARKQLGINAALQASEILVALISGLAQGAKVGGGLGAVISVTAIVAAIAGAFAIAESLKPTTPSFFIGTKDTGTGGRQDSKGGFSATLHPHEAIIPQDRNKAYKPTVAAIFDKTIPAEHLNSFVNNYRTTYLQKSEDSKNQKEVKSPDLMSFVNNYKTNNFQNTYLQESKQPLIKEVKVPVINNAPVIKEVKSPDLVSFVNNYHPVKMIPQPNYIKIKETAEFHVTHDGRMSVLLAEHSNLLKENNELQKQILKKQIKVENSIDRNGVATMVSEHIDLIKRSQKI